MEETMNTSETTRDSTIQDYINVTTSVGIQAQNPQLRYNIVNDFEDHLDVEDPTFLDIYDKADVETQRELLKATSVPHALKIAERRQIFADSAKAVSQDSLPVQLGMGAAAIVTDPLTYATAPLGGLAAKAFQVGKAANRISRIARITAAGAVTGAAENAAVELALGEQGIQNDPMSAAFIGMAFGGGLGLIGASLFGPNGKQLADSMLSKEFDEAIYREPNPAIEVVDGKVRIKAQGDIDIGQMKSFGMDKILDFFRSDINIMYQSDSQVIRNLGARLSDATTSHTDINGNVVPNMKTGFDDKMEANGVLGNLINNITGEFNKARDLGYKGTREEFLTEVSDIYVKAARDQEIKAYKMAQEQTQRELDEMEARNEAIRDEHKKELEKKESDTTYEKMAEEAKKPKEEKFSQTKIEKMFETNLAKAYDSLEPKFNHPNSAVVEAANKYREYYNAMLERGKERKVMGLGSVSTSKVYRPRAYDYKKIKNMDRQEIFRRVRNGLAAHPNQAGLSSEALDKAANELTQNLLDGSFSLDSLTSSFMVKDNVPFDSMLKQRKWKLDELQLGDMIKSNLEDVTGAYHYKMSGRQATAFAFGTDDIAEIVDTVQKALIEEGKYNKRDLEAFQRTVHDLMGNLRMNQLSDTPAWEWTRNLLAYNSSRLGGGFGGNQFIEAVSAVTMNGFNGLFNGRFGNTVKNSAKALYRGGKVDDDFANVLINSGYLQDTLQQHRANRISDAEAGFNSGVLENRLLGFSDTIMKYTGMRYFMGFMEDMTGGAIMDQIKNLGKLDSISSTETKRLARWGLTHKQAKSLGKELEEVYNPQTGEFRLQDMSQGNRDRFQLAITKGIQEIVIQGDSVHLPAWMKAPSPMLKLITQFMRFPMIANNVLLQRGMSEDQARLIGGAFTSMVTYLALKSLREEASVALGYTDELDRKYDFFNPVDGKDNLKRATMEAWNYTAQLGMLSTVFNAGATMAGYSELGRNFVPKSQLEALAGPTFGGAATDTFRIISNIAQGEVDENTYKTGKMLLPFNNIPMFHEMSNALIEEGF